MLRSLTQTRLVELARELGVSIPATGRTPEIELAQKFAEYTAIAAPTTGRERLVFVTHATL